MGKYNKKYVNSELENYTTATFDSKQKHCLSELIGDRKVKKR